jgi:hypothetical protein
MRRARGNDTVTLLNEAEALERLGGTWTQKHAAAVAGCSVSFLRISDCPKDYEEGHGPQGKPRTVYVPAKVRAWKQSRRLTQRAG